MSRRLTLGTLLVAVLCLLVSVYAVHGNQRSYRARPIDKQPLQLDIDKDVRALCVYKNHNDTGSSIYSSAQAGDAFFTYVNPESCGFDPTYPFSVDGIQLTLADFTGAVWPVDVSIEVWVGNQDAPCAGPHQLIMSEVFTLSEADFAAPTVGRIELTDPICVGGPFYVAVRYEGSTSTPYPAVVFDCNGPIDTCYN
ncbi:hypothetical protein GF356_09485, partial [candidate division GN15 bacterium]|nr:hypothetical protein [candidate division GN15 bacterium]